MLIRRSALSPEGNFPRLLSCVPARLPSLLRGSCHPAGAPSCATRRAESSPLLMRTLIEPRRRDSPMVEVIALPIFPLVTRVVPRLTRYINGFAPYCTSLVVRHLPELCKRVACAVVALDVHVKQYTRVTHPSRSPAVASEPGMQPHRAGIGDEKELRRFR